MKKMVSLMVTVAMLFVFTGWLPTNYGGNIIASAADVSTMNPVDSTYAFIKEVESFSSECFWDVSQWTIGYGNKCPYSHSSNGSSNGQKGGHTITEAYARQLFEDKLTGYVNTLKSNCKGLSMTQNQFDALLSATYNHGNVNYCPLKYYLQGTLSADEARAQYLEWCINKGTNTEQGLRNRRKKEANLFFNGIEFNRIDTKIDSRYNTNVSCTAPSQIHTYDAYGSQESNRWVDAGDSCTAIEAYTSGYWKIDYPAGSDRRIAYMKLSEWNPFTVEPDTILPGTVDSRYNKNVSCTAPSQIHTYDTYGNQESNRWVDAGDSCTAIEAYTNGYWKIDYPAGSRRRTAYMKLSEWNPFTVEPDTILPGTVDTRYNKNVSCTAPSQIHTYDANGNQESNRWVDAGDSCTAIEAYTNGYWKIDYPAGSSRRIAYMKLSEWNPFGSAHSHIYTSKVTTQPTCTASGIRTYSCSCGDNYTETIPATGHKYVVTTIEPTATSMGYDKHTCTICNYSFKDNYTDKLHTHSYTSKITKEPTCTADGIRTYSCSCGDTYAEIIEAVGHKYSTKTVAPTATSQGYDLHTCTVCNYSYKDNYTDVHTHSYTGKVTKAATCTEDGVKTYTCSCGKSYIEIIKATGHKYTVTTVAPTATEAGYDLHTCSQCYKFYIDNVIPAGTVSKPVNNPVVTYEKGDGCVKLTWNKVEGADKYAVYGFMSNKWKSIAQGSETSYTLKNLTSGKQYKIVVVARSNGKWNTSDLSNALIVTPKEKTPEYPVIVSRSVSGNSLQLKWTAVKGAQNYGIAYYTPGGWKMINGNISANTVSYTANNVPSGTYKMVICAKVNGKWETSNIASRAFYIAV